MKSTTTKDICWVVGLAVALVAGVILLSRMEGCKKKSPEIKKEIQSPPLPPMPGQTPTALADMPDVPVRYTSTKLAWDPSPDPSIVLYRIHYGGESGFYTNTVTTSSLTLTISNLVVGSRYYFAATALDTDGWESRFSEEVSWPTPSTNYVCPFVMIGDSPTGPWVEYWSSTFTNPSASQKYFRFGINSSNLQSVLVLDASTLVITN